MERDDKFLISLLLFGAGFAILYNLARYSTATDTGGGAVFEPYAPSDPIGGVLNMLVPMQVSPSGRAFIKHEEAPNGPELMPYPDAGGQSIGYGHFIEPGEDFSGGITLAEADSLFDSDLSAREDLLNSIITVQVSQNQFDALADWAYNEPPAQVKSSTLIRLLNAGDYAGAAAQLPRWVYSQGQVNPALQARRASEANVFNG